MRGTAARRLAAGSGQVLFVVALALAFGCQALRPAPAREQSEAIREWQDRRGRWPPSAPGLVADPALWFGELANGLRFVWLHDTGSVGRCSIRLVVHVGSRDETDGQSGMAHFVEHMAFNGTRRFPGTTIWQWFQAHGMRSGQHANAVTTEVATIYQADLPDNSSAGVQDGLSVLREFADGVLFEAEEVAKEKGVIDAEQRYRGDTDSVARDEELRRLLLGSGRDGNVIGDAAERAQFTAERLRQFHAQWYRPDNMTVVFTGDLDSIDVEAACREAFGGWTRPMEPLPARAPVGLPSLADATFDLGEPNGPTVEWRVRRVHPRLLEPTTAVDLRAGVVREAAGRMGHWLLAERLERADSLVCDFLVRIDGPDPQLAGGVLRFSCRSHESREALGSCARALGGLSSRCFDADRLASVRDTALARLAQEQSRRERADCVALAKWLAECVADAQVPIAATTRACLEQQAWLALTPQQCAAEWQAAWSLGRMSFVSVGAGSRDFDAAGVWRSNVLDASEYSGDAWEGTVEGAWSGGSGQPDAIEVPAWPYATDAAGAPVPTERRQDAALDVEQVAFANGVQVLIKPTSFTPGQILVGVNFGPGPAGLPDRDRHALCLWRSMREHAGLQRITADDLRQLTERAGLRVAMGADWDSCGYRCEADRASLQFLLEWLSAEITDLRLDEGARRTVVDELAATPDAGQQRRNVSEEFLSRVVGQTVGSAPGQIAAIDLVAVEAWYGRFVRPAPIRLVLVGDIDVERAIGLVGQTFGRLPPRTQVTLPAYFDALPEAAQVRHEVHEESFGAAHSVVSMWAPLIGLPPEDLLAMQALCDIVSDRLMDRLREDMATAYSCRLDLAFARCAPTCWLLRAWLPVEPGQEDRVSDAARQLLDTLARTGVTAAEVEGARTVLRADLRRGQVSNAYWMSGLASGFDASTALRRFATLDERISALTMQHLSELAARFFLPERFSSLVFRVTPPK